MRVTKRQLRQIVREAALEESLWKNVHKKRKAGRPPAKPGDDDYPDEKAWKAAQEADDSAEDVLKEILAFILEQDKDRMKCNKDRYLKKGEKGYGKKQKVVKACDDGEEKLIKFGDGKMKNKSNVKKNKKSFRARHNCDQKKDKMTAGYWSCKDW